jgi:catechol 2,3-dioxygenase-like lactoylglutathione lyase family enzyme
VTFLFGAPGKGLDLYHVGLTVPDLHAAMERYSEAFGFGWATVKESTHAVVVDGEARQAQIAVTYSRQGPPYLELIEERQGAIWGADGLALTHVGFWAEDVGAAMRVLDASGVSVRVHADPIDGRPVRYSYHQFGGGLWIELVHTSFEEDLTDWIAQTLDEGR